VIVKIHSSGGSFKGLAQYLTHDPHAKTAERVAWTHTINCAHDTCEDQAVSESPGWIH
jgi:hypothetical protein